LPSRRASAMICRCISGVTRTRNLPGAASQAFRRETHRTPGSRPPNPRRPVSIPLTLTLKSDDVSRIDYFAMENAGPFIQVHLRLVSLCRSFPLHSNTGFDEKSLHRRDRTPVSLLMRVRPMENRPHAVRRDAHARSPGLPRFPPRGRYQLGFVEPPTRPIPPFVDRL
jgi:hypothetical protein